MRWFVVCIALGGMLIPRFALARASEVAPPAESIELRADTLESFSLRLGEPITYTRPVRVLPFQFRTSRRAGLVVQAVGDTVLRQESDLLREHFQDRRRWLGAEPEAWKLTGSRHLDIGTEWCKNGHVPFPDTTAGVVRVTWLTYDTAPLGPSSLRRAARRLDAVGDADLDSLLTRVVGSVLVDLASGRVIQRRGRVL